MGKNNDYKKKQITKLKAAYDRLCSTLPSFAVTWLNSKINLTWSSRVAYASDIMRFLNFVMENVEGITATGTVKMTLSDIADNDPSEHRFTDDFFNAYVSFLHECDKGNYRGNNRNSIERKMTPIRSLYLYYCNRGEIRLNPLANFEHLKEPESKTITHMNLKEVKQLFYRVESGRGLTEHQIKYWAKTRKRDYAIIMLLLGTGIRVSELVGSDITDVNLADNSLRILRKGEHEDIVYYNKDVSEALTDYIENERADICVHTDENPLFYSLRGTRISVDAVEIVVSKYTGFVTNKRITCHKLRATFGTMLYAATSDLALTQDALGHSSPTTTKKYYVDSREENKKKSGKMKLY